MKDIHFDKPVTSKEVAKLAGVSQSSVSRTFSAKDGNGVSQQVRKKILEAAEQLGYKPNFVARGMISGKTHIIGLVVHSKVGPFYHSVIMGIMDKVQASGKQCLVFKINEREKLSDIISKVSQFQVEAIIITASAVSKDLEKSVGERRIPIILFNRHLTGMDANSVYTDKVQGAIMVADYLYSMGHSKIGFIRYFKDTMDESEKEIGFFSQLRRHKIFSITQESSDYTYESGYEAGKRFLSKNPRPTAIFCTSDIVALGLMDVARYEFGLKIPEDLSVIGYDNIPMASWQSYQLTTICQPVEELTDRTVRSILNMLDNIEEECKTHMIDINLVERKSVCKLPR